MFATAQTIVDAIEDGRGFQEAAAVLGAEFDGMLIRDGWPPIDSLTARPIRHVCHRLSHVVRRCREITETHPRLQWPRHVQRVLQDLLAVGDRVTAGDMSLTGVRLLAPRTA